MSKFMGCNWRPVVPRVLDADKSPRAFRRAVGQSRSLDERQNRYLYDTLIIVVGFRGVIMELGPPCS
jgi:hypothetical protein